MLAGLKKIAVISDTHDDEKTIQVLEFISQNGIDTVIHCGDMCRPDTAQLFRAFRIFLAFGNNDRDQEKLQNEIRKCQNGSQSSNVIDCTLYGKRIGAIHDESDPEFQYMIDSGKFDFIFVGHTHKKSEKRLGKTRIMNPGAIVDDTYGIREFLILNTDGWGLTNVFIKEDQDTGEWHISTY